MPEPEPEVHGLSRQLGTGLLVALVVGDILGAGIYVLVGEVARDVGGLVWLPFTLALVIAGCTASSYAALAARFPHAAGSAHYVDLAFGLPAATFLTGFAVVASAISTSAAVSRVLSAAEADEDDETVEDEINRLMEAKKLLPNASYFAFTATPKNKTLEIFGTPEPQSDGSVRHRPFHTYTMKQAIQEGFILDVLKHYTPVESYYRLVKTIDTDPEFDKKRATRKLRRYVESHDVAIRLKAEIMVDHFHEQVIAQRKIDGEARAMVVTSGIERAIQYFQAITAYLTERKSPYKAIVAFSGEHEVDGKQETEASLNGFPSNQIADKIQEDPYRFLVCADKFQTGYDEPRLRTMYVDKMLSGVKAVQTLSRLNRAHPKKHDVFVLDFMNDVDIIQKSFEP